ncbi:fluoride efflux transporter CrcB [Brevibacillus sp. SYP-B805]|uniref:fluoride efflux transporter CrcB n=1 Tax=Brevibacillus sp. SYP-B805 TaxID=1578199 RepID=UPI0013ED74E5|nr:fluoride efflux transporter CrcB [Brevibacillus sp. SYP-B805]NGQ96354.1 fluoride efflux transporter CrcB [Brevibacillus sp. SYP-B805]
MIWLAVAVGGAAGSLLRYALGLAANAAGWPWGTWLANVLGSFCIGLFFVWGKEKWPPQLYLLLTTGLLGGFTTFSTFSLETVTFFLQGQVARGAVYALTSVGVGLAAAFVGMWVGRLQAW